MKTIAERRRTFRERRREDSCRINVFASPETKARLDRLADYHWRTQGSILARVLAEAEDDVLGKLGEAGRFWG